ncbi:MAG: hypothetical protein ACRD3N_11695 [Terracidiphilus sp.]
MTRDGSQLTCAQFQDHLPELIASGESMASHPHYRSCDLCRAFLSDLETIAQAARELFPAVEPSDELWKHIETAIQNEGDSKGAQGARG